MRLISWALLLGPALLAQEPDGPTARLGVGAFTDRFSDATGTWKGWMLNAEWFRDASGPWVLSAIRTERPEGTGSQFTLGKEQAFGEYSWAWLGVGTGSGADYLPSFRGMVDLNLALDATWAVGLGVTFNRFRDGSSTTVLQAGPAWTGEDWSSSLRVQQVRYSPGSEADTGLLLDVRWGASNLRRWHSLRLGHGEGVLDALQTGGSLSSSTSTLYSGGQGWGGGSGYGGGGNGGGTSLGTTPITVTTTRWIYPAVKETLVSTSHHLPITRRLALRADLAWGRRDGQFTLWSTSLQALVTF